MSLFSDEPLLADFPRVGAGADAVEIFLATIRRLSYAKTVEEVMAAVTPATRRLLKADGVTFVLKQGDLCHYADEDAISPLWKGRRFPLDDCISGWCIKKRRAVAVTDIYRDERIPHDAYRPTFVRSLAMAPVRREDPIAAIGAYWAEEQNVSADELGLLQTMADASALAIASATRQQRDEEYAALLRERATAAENAAATLRESERHLQLLASEIDHRAKNLLTLITSLLQFTRADNVESFKTVFNGRIMALARAHNLLAKSRWEGADLRQIIEDELAPYRGGEAAVGVDGAAIMLRPMVAQAVGLAIHEMTTNAVKHGALSCASGQLSVNWETSREEIVLKWIESGCPAASAAPADKGFGMRVINRIVAQQLGGQATFDWLKEGISATFTLPIAQLHE